MPYVEGESLRDRLNREPQLPLDTARQIAREPADALTWPMFYLRVEPAFDSLRTDPRFARLLEKIGTGL